MKKIRDIFILTAGRILIVLVSIVYVRILTTLLLPREVGRLNILLSICGWFGLVLVNPVGMYINRKLIEWNKEGSARTYLIYLVQYFLVVSIFAVVSISFLNYFVGLGINVDVIWLFILVSASILLTSGNSSFLGYLNLLGSRAWFVSLTILTLLSGLGFSAFFVLRLFPTAECWLSGQLLTQGVIFIFAMTILFRKLQKPLLMAQHNKDTSFTLPAVFHFAWPLAIGTFLYWCHTQGYRFAFQKIAGLEALGLFVVGFGIGSNLMVSFDTLFNQYYYPIFYNEISHSTEEQRTNAWNKYACAFFPAVVPVAIYVAVNGPLIAKVFTGEKFHQVGNIIFWGALAECLRMAVSVVGMVSHAQFKMKPLILPGITGVFTAIIGVFLFVRIHPFIGGGLALTLGWLLVLIHMYRNMKKLLPIQIPWKRIFYSLILGIPLLIFFTITRRIFHTPTIFQSLIVLSSSGLYLLLAQFILARKWLSLPIKIAFIDEIEQKLRSYLQRDL